jgi:hypothetical protein
MSDLNYTYNVGDKVEVRDPATGYWRPAWIESLAPCRGRPGYYIYWEFGRKPESWESTGGWTYRPACAREDKLSSKTSPCCRSRDHDHRESHH